MWKELDERYSQSTPLPVTRHRFYQLDLHELHSRWHKQEPGGQEDDILLRDQFILGLDDEPVKARGQGEDRPMGVRAPAGAESPLDLPEAEGLTPD
ncbi:hypothetical protein SKAU_G00414150 [Synaphobranchus kaupii]|uniref:Uncharacterized protein n=1 Tax=Synaphobranchus kaupii TaxID=118154 RepID=A0A9Q1IBB1_SYNKA|nr:hypothetical protein SKAU_G00414150 [Synaphobranchus kaupii]